MILGEFPWTIAIFRIDNTSAWTYQCGGSLIHPSVVLTAAHCVYGIKQSELTLRAGEWDTQTTDEPWPHQERNVEQIVIHENFDNRRLYHDMALLYLTKPVDLVENVNTVCLPPQAHIFDGSRCFASGWGKDQFGLAGKLQVIQKKIELPVVERSSCVQQLRTTRLGAEYKLHESFICAGGEMGKDTCSGDGGSPLVKFTSPSHLSELYSPIHIFHSPVQLASWMDSTTRAVWFLGASVAAMISQVCILGIRTPVRNSQGSVEIT